MEDILCLSLQRDDKFKAMFGTLWEEVVWFVWKEERKFSNTSYTSSNFL